MLFYFIVFQSTLLLFFFPTIYLAARIWKFSFACSKAKPITAKDVFSTGKEYLARPFFMALAGWTMIGLLIF